MKIVVNCELTFYFLHLAASIRSIVGKVETIRDLAWKITSTIPAQPNPLTARVKLYNDVLTHFLETTYHLVPPIQFKGYVIEQRITRWKIEKIALRLESKTENMFSRVVRHPNW